MYRFIIVDDEPLIRMGTLKKLEPLFDQITCVGEADNGQEASVLVQQLHPDFAILDMEMPVMDGTELLPWLAEQYPAMQLIVISGYKSFDYMKHAISAKAIDYILKPFTAEQIQETVCQAMKRLETNESIHARIRLSEEQKEQAYYEYDLRLLQNMILGYSPSDTALSSQRLHYLKDSHRLYLAVLLSEAAIDDWDPASRLTELGYSEMALYLPHPSHAQIGFFIICIPEGISATPQSFLNCLLQDLSVTLPAGAEPRWAISASVPHPEQLAGAYTQCRSLFNSMPLTQKQPCCYHWKPNQQSSSAEIIWPAKNEFLFRIEAGMTEDVHRMLGELGEYCRSIDSITLSDMKYLYYRLTEDCLLILKRYLNQADSSQSMQNIVQEIFFPDELDLYFARFFENLSEMLRPHSIYRVKDTIEQVQIYTQQNYQKPISVDFLASLFYMNSSYLSHLFRRKTGVKYAQYLNSIRIDRAKELLSSTDRKLYQITKNVGYDNSKYFFRVFKKATGMTPEQYRTSHRSSTML